MTMCLMITEDLDCEYDDDDECVNEMLTLLFSVIIIVSVVVDRE